MSLSLTTYVKSNPVFLPRQYKPPANTPLGFTLQKSEKIEVGLIFP